MPSSLNAALTGLGMAGLARSQPFSAVELALQAIDLALDDAGLARDQIDGLLVSRSGVAADHALDLRLKQAAGLHDLNLLQFIDGEGTSALQMVHTAAMAVSLGLARHVACVFADAPLRGGQRSSQAFGSIKSLDGIRGLRYSSGLFGAPAVYAMATRRHMHLYGTTSEQLGAVAVTARRWAALSPHAIFREPLSIEQYLASRPIAEPLRLYDCAIPVDGGIAVVVSATEAARDLRQPAVHVLGLGQGHPGHPQQRPFDNETSTGARQARDKAFSMANITANDIDLLQCYDAFTYMTLLALEEYGFCGKGEGGAYVAAGHTAPGGRLPTNTGGGHLSGYYLQGMTPLSEAIMQVRGQAGDRQCKRHDVALVTNEGGFFDYHACLVLGSAGRA
jgi:acetyl-CoA acetyltransferase